MDAVSRESYTAAVERLDGLRHRRAAGAARRGRRRDPGAWPSCWQRQPRLRRALSDPSRPGEDRAELLGSIAATARSRRGRRVAAAHARGRPLVVARPSCSTRPSGSASRLCWPAPTSAGELAEVEDELFRFGQVVDGDNRARRGARRRRTAPAAQRSRSWRTRCSRARRRPATVRLVDVALRGFGGRNFAGSLTRLVELAAERRDRQIAYVTVAEPADRRRREPLGQPPGPDLRPPGRGEGDRGPEGPRRRERPHRTRPVRRHRAAAA